MLLTSFPDLLSFQRQSRVTGNLKARLETVSIEAVTGQTADITKAVNGDMGGVLLMQKALDDIEQDERINAISAARLALITTSMTSVREVAGNLGTEGLIAVSAGDTFTLDLLATQADGKLRSTMSLLNITHGSRNLFSGDATDQPSLASADVLLTDIKAIMAGSPDPAVVEADLETYFNDPAGGFATNIYQGGDGDVAPTFLADGTQVNFNVRADNQAIRDTLRGLAVMAVANNSAHDPSSVAFKDIFTQGTNVLTKGANNIIKIEGEIGIYENLIEDMNAQQADERITLSLAMTALTGRDQFDAAAELKQLETQLEASYLVTARLSGLNLTNFLR